MIKGVNFMTKNSNLKRKKADMKVVAEHLNEGCIIGWFKGKFEFGPRALGARSVLVRPTDAETHEKLNKRLGRNEVMPFAPIVLGDKANDVFITNNKYIYIKLAIYSRTLVIHKSNYLIRCVKRINKRTYFSKIYSCNLI